MRGLATVMLLAAGCGGAAGPNPHRLWIAPNGSELRIQLVAEEPNPF
jgi:hypothetical protein